VWLNKLERFSLAGFFLAGLICGKVGASLGGAIVGFSLPILDLLEKKLQGTNATAFFSPAVSDKEKIFLYLLCLVFCQ
jgi:hypothetical protein